MEGIRNKLMISKSYYQSLSQLELGDIGVTDEDTKFVVYANHISGGSVSHRQSEVKEERKIDCGSRNTSFAHSCDSASTIADSFMHIPYVPTFQRTATVLSPVMERLEDGNRNKDCLSVIYSYVQLLPLWLWLFICVLLVSIMGWIGFAERAKFF